MGTKENKIKAIPVMWVDLDDIENAGFESEEISQELLEEIANEIAEWLDDSFQSAFYEICKSHGIKQKE